MSAPKKPKAVEQKRQSTELAKLHSFRGDFGDALLALVELDLAIQKFRSETKGVLFTADALAYRNKLAASVKAPGRPRVAHYTPASVLLALARHEYERYSWNDVEKDGKWTEGTPKSEADARKAVAEMFELRLDKDHKWEATVDRMLKLGKRQLRKGRGKQTPR